MKNGGQKTKGNNFERAVGKELSLWLTDGEKPNIFARNVLSGGSFTVTLAKGVNAPNIPGDLMAASPLAFEFLSLFSIECKHRASIDLEVYLRDVKGTSFLSQTIKHTRAQATHHNLSWLVVAKENRHGTLVFMDYAIGKRCIPQTAVCYHILHNETVLMTTMEMLLTLSVRLFLIEAKKLIPAPRILPVTPRRLVILPR